MRYELRQAIESWEREVSVEQIRLIARGVSPYAAAQQATDRVSARRAARAAVDVITEVSQQTKE